MKTPREHYELMHKQIEEELKKNYEEKLQKVTENAIGTLADMVFMVVEIPGHCLSLTSKENISI